MVQLPGRQLYRVPTLRSARYDGARPERQPAGAGRLGRRRPLCRPGFRRHARHAGRDGARALNPPKVPAASFELRNDTAKYSHENPASPVYQRIKPGVPVQVQARWGATRLYRSPGLYRAQLAYRGVAVWNFATSRIDETRQTTQLGQQRLAVSTLGASSTLVGRAVSVPLQASINTAYVVGLLLAWSGT